MIRSGSSRGGRIQDDKGIRGGSPFAVESSYHPAEQRNTGMASSALPGHPHSSEGFRRAIKRATNSPSRLVDKTHFGGNGFTKPNYFAQGGQRHGMHIGSGAPAIRPARHLGGGSFGTS